MMNSVAVARRRPAAASLWRFLHAGGRLLQEVTHVPAPEPVTVARRVMPLPEFTPAPAEPEAEPAAALPLPKLVHLPPRPQLPLREAIAAVKRLARAKFPETVEVSLRLGIDPKRSDQLVRGVAALPHGTGKAVRVAVFTTGAPAEEARRAGADVVGGEELIAAIKAGGVAAINFDKAVATPDMMPQLSQIARLLGPRGLMPNPKLGTLTTNVAVAVAAMRQGQVQFRADRYALVHAPLGKVDFSDDALLANAAALLEAVVAARPKGVKLPTKGAGAGGFIRGAHLSTTMGRGSVPISLASLSATGAGA